MSREDDDARSVLEQYEEQHDEVEGPVQRRNRLERRALADLDRSVFMAAPGQSGRPFSRHAHDMMERWRDGGTVPLGREPARTEAVLRLIP